MFRFCLKMLRKVAVFVQIGNPALKAPLLIPAPEEEEKMHPLSALPDGHFFWQLKNVLCSGLYGGAIINEKNQVYSRFTFFPWGKELHLSLSLPFLGRKVAVVEKAVFLLTPDARGNYYHWMTDLLPRLLLLIKSGLPDFEERNIILHDPARRYEEDTFSLLGLPAERLIRLKSFETVAVKDLLLVDFIRLGRTFPEWKRPLLQSLKEKLQEREVPKKEGRKIYLRRGKQAKRCLIGEEKLVVLLRERGFDILDPDRMSLREQISALSEACLVLGLHGAALTNIIFCKEGTYILELRSRDKAPEHYAEMAKTCKLVFDSISLPPEKTSAHKHQANKQHLLLTAESISSLLAKVEAQELDLSIM